MRLNAVALKRLAEILTKFEALTDDTIDQLIILIETLASVSVSAAELKLVFNLFLVADNKLVIDKFNFLHTYNAHCTYLYICTFVHLYILIYYYQ